MNHKELTLSISLDEKKIPKKITWKSDDAPSNNQEQEAKAFFLSLIDKETLETLKIDLWTGDLQIGEMNRLVYYSLKAMADTYFNGTKNSDLANDLARFAQYFGEESGVLIKPNS